MIYKNQKEFIGQLRSCMYLMNEEAQKQKKKVLLHLADFNIHNISDLQLYHDALLFLLAYPQNEELWKLTKNNLEQLTKSLQEFFLKASDSEKWKLQKSGIAFTELHSCFSYKITKWLSENFNSNVEFYSCEADSETLKMVFRQFLPAGVCEKYFEDDYTLEKLAKTISLNKKIDVLNWTLTQFKNSEQSENLKEQSFGLLKIYIGWKHNSDSPSRTIARGPSNNIFFQNGQTILKKVDLLKEVSKKNFLKTELTFESKERICSNARGILCSLYRETDPITYASINETDFFELDRGVSASLFYMTPEFRLPLESYVGYLAYRNNIPIAYGGGWAFQGRARFGINVLPSFRGGESSFIFSQLIRLYQHRLGVNYFHIEPYQIGHKNSDGIKSGAFWFYYRMGFRPLQKELAKIAEIEFEKIKSDKTYRTEKKILVKLAASELMIDFSTKGETYVSPNEFARNLQLHVSKYYQGDFNAFSLFAKNQILKQFKKEQIKIATIPANRLFGELCMYLCMDSNINKRSVTELKILAKAIDAKCSGFEFEFIDLLKNTQFLKNN